MLYSCPAAGFESQSSWIPSSHTHTLTPTDNGTMEVKLEMISVFLHVCLESGLLENICDFLQGHFPVRKDFPFLKTIKFTFECECGER